jgi:RNA polymerase sigma-70 factor, ECF subfamily
VGDSLSEDGVGSLRYPQVVRWTDDRADLSEARDTCAVVTGYYLALQPSLNRFIRWRIGNRADAEELTQEVFLRLYVHLRAGHTVSNVRAWTFAVARHMIVDARRRHGADPIWNAAEAIDVPCEREAIDLRIERLQREAVIHAAIEDLPTLQRQCLTLRADGLRLREVAETLNCTISTVASSLQRAFTNVRRRLAREQSQPPGQHGRPR